MKNKIVAHNGSIQNIDEIPANIKELYKTIWEISQRTLIDMAADRGAFIDQSQSFNVFIETPTFAKLTSMHFYGWKKGLKTGMYYLRTRPAVDAIKFTVGNEKKKEKAFHLYLEMWKIFFLIQTHSFLISQKDPITKPLVNTSPNPLKRKISEISQSPSHDQNIPNAQSQPPVQYVEGAVCRKEEGCLVCSS